MKKRKLLSRINALVLVGAICAQSFGTPLISMASEVSTQSNVETGQKLYGQINGTYSEEYNAEVISLETQSLLSNVNVTYISLPDGTRAEGGKVDFPATQNGLYRFAVVYEETMTFDNENGEPVEYVLNGEQMFEYEVTSIRSVLEEEEEILPESSPQITTQQEQVTPEVDETTQEQVDLDEGETTTQETSQEEEVTPEIQEQVDLNIEENIDIPEELQEEYEKYLQMLQEQQEQENQSPYEIIESGETFINEQGEEEEIIYTKMSGAQYLQLVVDSDATEYYTWLMTEQAMDNDGDIPVEASDVMLMSSVGLTFNSTTQTITAYTNQGISSAPAALTIPAQIDGVDVLHIAASVFYGTYYINSLTFEEGSKLQTIGYRTFRNSYLQGSVTLPSTVTSIGEQAFYGSAISSITIPGSLTRIETYTFYNCVSLERVSLPETLTYIGTYAFENCTALMTINFPSKLTTIDSRAFRACTSLLSAALPATVTSIGNYAFFNNTSLANLTFAGGVTSIGSYAFNNTAIQSVTFPPTLKTIGTFAFQNCSNLSTITAQGTLEAIGGSAFNAIQSTAVFNFTGNTSSNLTGAPWGLSGSSYVMVWQGYAYANNFILNTATGEVVGFITDGRDAQEIPALFTDATGKTHAPTSIADSLFSGNTVITEITLPDSIKSIGYRTFYGCTKLGTINMPANLEVIGNQAFYNCTGLSDIRLNSKLTTIGSYAFFGCTGLGTLTIPDSVTSIATYAFSGATKIADVTIGSGVTVLNNYVFNGNTALKTVTVKGNMSSISSNAFNSCTNIGQIYFTGVTQAQFLTNGGSVSTQWGATNATIVWSDVSYSDGYIFDQSTGTITGYTGTDTVIEIPETIDGVTVKHIGASVFYANTSITEVYIPDTVETIGVTAFYRCTKLRKVEIGAGITTIGANAFAMQSTGTSYTSMAEMIIHGMTTASASIAGNAFTNFPATCVYHFTQVNATTGLSRFGSTASVWGGNSGGFLTWSDIIRQDDFVLNTTTGVITTWSGSTVQVEIPDDFYRMYTYDPNDAVIAYQPTSIGDSVFTGKSSITSIYIPNTIVSIGSSSFNNCNNLSTISGGEGIKSIGDYAFRYCYVLLNPPIYDGLISIGQYAFQQNNALTVVNIPDSTTSIGQQAFYYCGSLREISFGKGITDLPTYVVGYHSSYSGSAPLETVYMYGVMNSIHSYAFRYQYQTTEIILDNTVEGTVSNEPWGTSSSKVDIIYGHAVIEDGYVFNASTGEIVNYRGTDMGPTIPGTIDGVAVTKIGASAFASNTNLYEITIPSSVTYIDTQAFSGCTNLAKVNIQGDEDTPAITIGTQAFLNCSKLTELYVYGPVTSIASNALSGTSTLATVHFKHMPEQTVAGYSTRWGSGFTAMTIAWAETIIQDGFIFNTDTLSVTGYIGTSTSPNMPEKFYDIWGEEYTAIGIGDAAFTGKTTFVSFNMPDTVKTIGDKAFYGCTNLLAVVLSKGLESIGSDAFYNNTTLMGITLPDTLKSIGDNAFYNTNKMTNVAFGSGVETIGYRAFYLNSSLDTITLGESIKSVGAQAFASCTSLTRVTINGEMNSDGMGSGAFTSCSKIEYIQFMENAVNSVNLSPWGATNATVLWKGYALTDEFVFDGVNNTLIKYIGSGLEVNIPEYFEINGEQVAVEVIGAGAFQSNTKMMSLSIPDSVKTIGESAFASCTALAQISFGSGLEIIEDKAFQSCTTITKINLPESVRLIGASAFASCTKLEEISIPGYVEVISTTAFTSCGSLEIINLPKHTSATLSGANWGASSSTLTVVWSNLIYQDGFVYDIATETIIRYVGSAPTISIPEKFIKDETEYNPTNIGANVFQNKTFITKVIIPDTVEIIGSYAFSGCTKLTQLEIGNGVKEILTYAFSGCSTLTSIEFGDSIEEIGNYAFNSCTTIKSLNLPDSLITIGERAFYGLSTVTELVIPDKVKTIGVSAFYGASRLIDLTIGDSVTDIYATAFYGASKLSTIQFGSSVQNIWSQAFYNTTELSELILPESIRLLDSQAFALNSSTGNIMKEILINGQISSIASNAFTNRTNVEMIFLPECEENSVSNKNWGLTNSNLLVLWSNIILQDDFLFNSTTKEVIKYRGTTTTVTIPSVFSKDGEDYIPESIAASAFAYNTVLQSVTVPASITAVGITAFRNCTNLKEVVFVGKVDTIGTNAFLSCTNLDVIYLPQNEEGTVTGSPWGASTSVTTILWSNYVLQNGFIFDISTSEVFKYIGSDSDVIVPSTYYKWVTQADGSLEQMTYKATKIADNAFYGNTLFKSVTIAEGITHIGTQAFARAATNSSTTNTVLQTVTFPESLEIIDANAFVNCIALTEAVLPENLVTIGNYAFYNNQKLVVKEIGNKVRSIGIQAFRNCYAITDLTIGDSIVNIFDAAFYNCVNIKTLNIGMGIQSIGAEAFRYNSLLEKVYIHGNINAMPVSVFYNCTKLSEVHLPQKLENSLANSPWGASSALIIWKDIIYTGDYLFNTTSGTITKYYGSQTNVVIPKTFTKEVDGEEVTYVVQAIGASAFASNTIIQSVTVPDSVTDVAASAFRYCSNLRDITFLGRINTIGTNAFGSTTNLKIISLQENETGTVTGASWGNSAGDVIWSNNVYASDFIYDIDTKTVTKYIGSDTVISVPATFTKGDNTYNTEKIGTSLFQSKTTITKVTLPDTVTTIEYRAFYGCTYLTEIVLSANLTTIAAQAFYNCQRMHTAKLPATLETMGTYAFYQCYLLTEITIGDNLTEVPAYAFYNCYTVSKLTMGSGVKTIGEYAFYNTDALTEVTLGTGVSSISANAFNHASNLTKVTIPSNISTIGSYAFRNCSSLQEIHLPQKDDGTVTGATWGAASTIIVVWKDTILTDEYIYSISQKAITKYRGSATNVIVPSTLTKDGVEYEVEVIGASAFASNVNLVKVTLPETLKSVEAYAFQSCKLLQEIIFNSEIETVGYRGFYNLSAIKVVVFPENYSGTVGNQSGWGLSSSAVIVWKNLVYLDDFVYDIDSQTVTTYLGSATTVVVPTVFPKDGVDYVPVTLGTAIFQNKSTIVSVALPDGMEVIQVNAFRNMSKLKTVTLPKTLTTINGYAFYGSTAMTTCTFPDSLDIIEEYAFYNCDGLTEVTLPANMTRVGNYAFQNADNILKVTMKGKVTTLGTHIFNNNTKLNTIDIQEGVETIGAYMFYNCDLLTKALLPSTVTTIQNYAFGHNGALSQVFIPEATISIASTTFSSSNVISKIYVDQFKADNPLAVNAPWGAGGANNGYANVYWRGETIKFTHTIQNVVGENDKTINLTATLVAAVSGAVYLEEIILPDGSRQTATDGKWTGTYPVSANGTYTFIGIESNGSEVEYEVEVSNVGVPIISASNAYVESTDLASLNVAKIVEMTGATVSDDAGNVLSPSLITISQDDINEIKAMTDHNQSTMITLSYTYLEYGTVGTKDVVITLVKGKQIIIYDHNRINQGAYWMEYECAVKRYDKDNNLLEAILIDTESSSVTLEEPAAVNGYTFSYWNLKQGEDQSVSAVPVYVPNNMTIMFKDHEGQDLGEYQINVDSKIYTYDKEGEVLKSYTIKYTDTEYQLDTPSTVTGFDFKNWLVTKTATGDITATPIYTRQSYDVKVLDHEGEEVGVYSIEYDYNLNVYNHTDSITQEYKILEATTITLPEPSHKTGHTFVSWTGLKEATGNVAMKPSYSINSYQVTIKDNANVVVGQPTVEFGKKITAVNESGTEIYSETVTEDMSEMKLPSAPDKEGYSYSYWSMSFQGDGSVILKPNYTINSYTMTFVGEDGTEIRSLEQVYAEVLIAPTAPAVEGKTFTGWSPTVPDTVPSQDTTFTAQYTNNLYALTFWDDDGTIIGSSTLVEYNSIITAPTPTKTGYTFAGWSPTLLARMPATDTSFTATYIAGTGYTVTFLEPNGNTYTTRVMDTGDVVRVRGSAGELLAEYNITGNLEVQLPNLYMEGNYVKSWQFVTEDNVTTIQPVFEKSTYTIKFVMPDGTLVQELKEQVYGAELKAPTNPTMEGFAFDSWSPAVPATVPAADTTYTAVFNANYYTLKFLNKDGGTITQSSVACGADIVIPTELIPEVSGYTFSGWSPSVPSTMPAYDVEFTATYVGGVFDKTIDLYSHTGVYVGTVAVNVGDTISVRNHLDVVYNNIAINEFTGTRIDLDPPSVNSGYEFTEWSLSVDSENHYTLSPNYAQQTYTATFYDSLGNIIGTPQTLKYGDVISIPAESAVPAVADKTFSGWLPIVPSSMPENNMNFVAQYTDKDMHRVTITDSASSLISDMYVKDNAVIKIENGSSTEEITITGFREIRLPVAEAKEGYDYDTWQVIDNGDDTYTVEPLYTIGKYTMTFMANGSVYSTSTLQFGDRLSAPSDPISNEGKMFAGWDPIVPNTVPAQDTLFTAKFTEETGVLVYILNFEGEVLDQVIFEIGQQLEVYDENGTELARRTVNAATESFSLPEVPVKEGYTFTGWDIKRLSTDNLSASLTYEINTHTLKFVGEDGSIISSQEITYGTPIVEPTTVPQLSGKTFAGWTPALALTMPDEETTYTATYIEGEFNIVKVYDVEGKLLDTLTLEDGAMIYVVNEFGNEITTQTVTGDISVMLPEVPEKEGHDAADWVISVGANGNATIKRSYTLQEYTIAFMDVDGTLLSENTYQYGETVVQPDAPTSGGAFGGWLPDFSATATQDITYYAQYAESSNAVSVNFYDADGNFVGTKAINTGGSIIKVDSNDKDYGTQTITALSGTINVTLPELDLSDLDEPDDYELAYWELFQYEPGEDVIATAIIVERGNLLTFLDADGNVIQEGLRAPGRIIIPPDISNIPEVSGKTFSGWTPTLAEIMPDIPMTYTAIYATGDYHTVTIKAENGSILGYKVVNNEETVSILDENGDQVKAYTITADVTITLDNQEAKEGYTAEGYTITQSRNGESVTIQSVYEIIAYELIFVDHDGTRIWSDFIDYNTELTQFVPEKPTRAGYTFNGWSPTVSGNMPANDVTYTATYVEGEFHSIDIYTHDGVYIQTVTVNSGETIKIYAEDGSILAEYLIEDLTRTYLFGLISTNNTIVEIELPEPPEIENLTFVRWEFVQDEYGDSVTITAIYEGGPFTITFYDEDEETVLGGGSFAYASNMDIPLDPVKEGYSFTGWFNTTTETILDTTNKRVPNAHTDYVATYEINEYTISFEDEDGNPVGGELSSQILEYGTSFEVPQTPEKEGYLHDKWMVKDSDPVSYLDSENLIVPAQDVTYVLLYKFDTYTVTYYGVEEPGTDIHQEFTGVEYTSSVPQPDTIPEKEGYRFLGWSPIPESTMPAKDVQYWPTYAEGTGNVITIYDHTDKQLGSYIVVVDGEIIVNDDPEYTVYVTQEMTEIKLNAPTEPEGYSYDGWILSQEKPDANVTVTPQFVINSYNVSFVDIEGNSYTEDIYNITGEYGSAYDIPIHKPLSGYSFDGWVDGDGNQIPTNPTIKAKDEVYYATYRADNYYITFTDEDGIKYSLDGYNLILAYNSNIPVPEGVDKIGHTFIGWEDASGNVIDSSTTPAVKVPLGGITYKAKYEINQYNMVFYAEEYVEGQSSYEVHETLSLDYESGMQTPETTPKKEDHTFMGWTPSLPTTVPSENLEFWPTYIYGVGESIKVTDHNGAPVDTGYIMVEAGNKVIIEYDKDGISSSIEDIKTITVVENQADIQLSIPAIPTGHTFEGWEMSQGKTGTDVTYTPVYAKRSYTMTFTDEDGNTYEESQYNLLQEYQSSITVPEGKAILGYDFAGWVASDGSTLQTGETGVTMPAKNTTYTATYKIKQIYITYLDQVGDEITDYTKHLDFNSNFITPNGLEVEGYTFTGWSILAPSDWDNTQLVATGTTLIAPAVDVKFQAQYDINSYTVRFEDYNQIMISQVEQEYGSAIVAPSNDPTKTGYTFTGWVEKVSNEPLTTGAILEAKNVTYVATYEISKYSVVYYADPEGMVLHNSYSVEYEGDVPVPNTDPVKAGHTFLGWTPSIPESMPADSLEFYPIFADGIQDIIKIYDHSGKLVQSVIVDSGNTITAKYSSDKEFIYNITTGYPDIQLDEPPTPIGYIFEGWLLEQTVNGENVVLTPQYKKEVYTIKFVDYNGELHGGTISVQVLEYGSAVQQPSDPVRAGHTFTGWSPVFSATATGDIIYTATYIEKEGISINLMDHNSALVGTYAMEVGNKIDQYDNDGNIVKTTWIAEGMNSVKLEDPQEIEGFTFQNWEAVQQENGNIIVTPLFIGDKKNIQIVDSTSKVLAEVSMNVGNKVYQLNLAGEIIATIPVLANTTVIKATEAAKETGYTFLDEWNITKDEDGNYTIAPKYSINSYNIVFVDYDNWILQQQELDYAEEIIRPSDPIRPGYTFVGWNPAVLETVPAADTIHKAVYEEIVIEPENDPDKEDTTNPDGEDTTNPDGGTTNPDGGTTNPDGGTTNPDGGTTNPDGSTTNPDGSTTNPDGSTTNPDGSTTNPDGSSDDLTGGDFTPGGDNYYTENNYFNSSTENNNSSNNNSSSNSSDSDFSWLEGLLGGSTENNNDSSSWLDGLLGGGNSDDSSDSSWLEELLGSDSNDSSESSDLDDTDNDSWLASLFGNSSSSGGSSSTGSTNVTLSAPSGTTSGGTFTFPDMDMSGAEIITPGIGDINIDGATINTDTSTPVNRGDGGFLNVPVSDLRLYHLVFIGSGLLGFALMFRKRRFDDEYSDELFMRRLNKQN